VAFACTDHIGRARYSIDMKHIRKKPSPKPVRVMSTKELARVTGGNESDPPTVDRQEPFYPS
jgi:bacteriocin-like protein